MRASTTIPVLFLGVLGTFGFGCAGSTPAPEAPKQSEASPPSEEASDPSAASAHSLEVGMEFKEKDETEPRRASHDAPPTGSWKPVEKDKSIDSKGTPAK